MESKEKEHEDKNKSRKWFVCKWSMLMCSFLVIGSVVMGLIEKEIPGWFGTLAVTFAAVSGGYIGANTYQKTHQREQGAE